MYRAGVLQILGSQYPTVLCTETRVGLIHFLAPHYKESLKLARDSTAHSTVRKSAQKNTGAATLSFIKSVFELPICPLRTSVRRGAGLEATVVQTGNLPFRL